MQVINEWRGDATAKTQISRITIATAIVGAVYGISFHRQQFSYRAIEGDTPFSIAESLAEQLAQSSEWSTPVVTATQSVEGGNDNLAVITLSGASPGIPFGRRAHPLELPSGFIEHQQIGVRHVPHKLSIEIPAGTTGGNWTFTGNFGAGNETTASIAWNATATQVRDAILALATPASGDITVTQTRTDPRTFEVTVQGALSGLTVPTSINASGLQGHGKVVITREQTRGQNVSQLIYVSLEQSSHYGLQLTRPVIITINGISQNGTFADVVSRSYWESRLGMPLLSFHTVSSTYYGWVTFVIPGSGNVVSVLDVQAYDGWQRERAPSPAMQVTSPLQGNYSRFLIPNNVTRPYTVTIGSETTAPVESWGQLKSRLEALPSIGAGNVNVSLQPLAGTANTQLIVSFINALEFQVIPTPILSGSNPAVISLNTGEPPAPEIVSFRVQGDSGTFKLTYDATESASIAHNADDAAFTAILETLTGLDAESDFTVTRDPIANKFVVEFDGIHLIKPFTLSANNLTGGAVMNAVTVQRGVPGRHAVQGITFDPTTTAGTYRLGRVISGGDHWTVLNWNASVEAIQTALNTMIGANSVTVQRVKDVTQVTFSGANVRFQPQPLLLFDQSNLTVTGSGLTYEIVENASGPQHWNDGENWTLGHSPATGELAVLASGRSEILYGLNQSGQAAIYDGGILSEAELLIGQRVTIENANRQPLLSQTVMDASDFFAKFDVEALIAGSYTEPEWNLFRQELRSVFANLPASQQLTWRTSYPENMWSIELGYSHLGRRFDMIFSATDVSIWSYTPNPDEPTPYMTEYSRLFNTTGFAQSSLQTNYTISFPTTEVPNSFFLTGRTLAMPLYIVSIEYVAGKALYRVSDEPGGEPIELEGEPTWIGVALSGIQIHGRFTGSIGWPRRDTSGNWTDEDRHLSIGLMPPSSGKPNLEVGSGGSGDGPRRLLLDLGESHVDARIYRTQQGSDSPACQILNDNLQNSELLQLAGDVGLGIEPTEHCAFRRLIAFSGRMTAGTVDFQHLEDYGNAVQFVGANADSDTVKLRTR